MRHEMKDRSQSVGRMVASILLAVAVLALQPMKAEAGDASQGQWQSGTQYQGNNVDAQSYWRAASPIQSYLKPLTGGGFMRVQYGRYIADDGLLVEYYDESFRLKSTTRIAQELPIFGGFYASDTHYYLLTGQSNLEESPKVEVFRVTKYDRNWKRISSVGLYDCNTTRPFDAGSARMDMSGKYLLIRTAHEMYRASDGLNHQANVTMQIDTEQMKITDSHTAVANSAYGYVSHSFNQFIKLEDNHIIAVDHGDAYPRSIALLKYPTDISQGKFVPSYSSQCDVIDVLEFPGAIGDNTTGASVGGFEISDSSYLVAGNSVVQDEQNLTRRTRNIFVASVDKQTNDVSIKWLTNYAEGTETTSTPQMVAINKNRYMILWTREGNVYYTLIDGKGDRVTNIYSITGKLSDCVPVAAGGKVVWYVWEGWPEKSVKFYQIDTSNLSRFTVKSNLNDHAESQVSTVDTGLQYYQGNWYYVQDGQVDYNAAGLFQYEGSWWYVQNGQVNFQATGLYQYGGSWWYIQNGRVDFKATGLCQYGGSWWYVQNGKVNFQATGLYQYGGNWWYVQNGMVNFKATGLWNQFGNWWYVENGAVNFKATGLWNQFGSWWYVQNGAVNFKATGLCQYGGNWWYVENGAVNFNYNGQVPYGNAYYNVVNGRVVF